MSHKKLRNWLDNCHSTNKNNSHGSDCAQLFQIPIMSQERKYIEITTTIDNFEDILAIIDEYPVDDNVRYNIDIKSLHQIAEPLRKMNAMIGMGQMKDSILDQILYYLLGLHHHGEGDFMHVVIYGSPGTGKTEVAKIIGEIFSKLGVLKNNSFRKVTRAELVAGFLGQTATKTRDVIKQALGGVLFIDEAYSLGDYEKRDSFAKECLDTLCECLSEHKQELMVIIAGYETELKRCFFAYNEGLESRFPWRYETGHYTSEEMRGIFLKKVSDAGWSFFDDSELSSKYFEKHLKLFKHYGRDMEILFAKTKIAHARRVFNLSPNMRTRITLADVNHGLLHFQKEDNDALDVSTNMMYL